MWNEVKLIFIYLITLLGRLINMALRPLRLVKYQRNFSSSGRGRKYSTGPQLITPIDEAKRFMKDCFLAVGTPPENAEIVAANLLEADYRGHYSHGMNRLEMYIRDIQHGTTDAAATPVVLRETQATALLDGKNGLGAVVGKHSMDLAIRKAKEFGIGLVVARALPAMGSLSGAAAGIAKAVNDARAAKRQLEGANRHNRSMEAIAMGSNHYGIAGMYALQAIEHGLIGFSVTNTSPLMTPTRAKLATLGTNPLALGAPGKNGDNFVLDMATTAVALGKIELARRKGEPIPEGWALNDNGLPETNPNIAYNSAKLMPLGGSELNSGYKGYGLGMLVEIFCGILSGSAYGPHVRRWGSSHEVANLGQAFMAINPQVFAPGFEDRLQDLMTYLRNMEPVDKKKPVLVHGDKERIHMEKVCEEGGLRYVENQHKTNCKLAEELKVEPMVSKTC